ncbi:hypothetical protein ACLOJK_026384 [Asimina triloba]
MERKLSKVAGALKPSPIQELSLLAQRCNAINLAEGFPDFPAPPQIKEAAISAIASDYNQYRHVQGICDSLAELMKENYGLDVDPSTDIAICCGQTEAFAAAVLASMFCFYLNSFLGDEVLLFDPAYETYETSILLAGGTPVYVPLDPPCWSLDLGKLMKAFTTRTKAVVLNSPHNPTGKVFSNTELKAIARACCGMDCLAITDEWRWGFDDCDGNDKLEMNLVLLFLLIPFSCVSNFSFFTVLMLPLLQSDFKLLVLHIVVNEPYAKPARKPIFMGGVTGWRIGWAIAPSVIASAIRNIHIKLVDSAPAPFQEAALTALRSPPSYFKSLRTDYEFKRDYIVKVLSEVGLRIGFKPQGSFFVFAELPEECPLSDVEFVGELIKKAGVAAVPGRGFFHVELDSSPSRKLSAVGRNYQERYVRFAFCKSNATLAAAAKQMVDLVDGKGFLKLN